MADRKETIQDLELVYEYIRKEMHDIASRKCRMLDKVSNAIALLEEQNQDEKRFTANEVCMALICHGQSDDRFEWGEVIKYSPSKVEKILKGEM